MANDDDPACDAAVDALMEAVSTHAVGETVVAQAYNEARPRGTPTFAVLRAICGDLAQTYYDAARRSIGAGFYLDFFVGLSKHAAMGAETRERIVRAMQAGDLLGQHQGIFAGGQLRSVDWIDTLHPLTPCIGLVRDAMGDPRERGTGFLVGPDLLLTSAHVIWSVLEECTRSGRLQALPGASARISIEFHHPRAKLANGAPRRVGLAKDWLVCSSRPCGVPPDLDLTDDVLALENLDYALLRLSEPVGADLGKFFDIRDAPAIGLASTLAVVGHPGGTECRYHVDTMRSADARTGRFQHHLDVSNGMSGSPYVTLDGKVVGLHEGVVLKPSGELAYNRSVQMRTIRERLLLHPVDPLDARPWDRGIGWLSAASSAELIMRLGLDERLAFDRHPILGREDFRAWIEEATAPDAERRVALLSGEAGSGKSFCGAILADHLYERGEAFATIAPEAARSADVEDIFRALRAAVTSRPGSPMPGLSVRPDAGVRRHDTIPDGLDGVASALGAPAGGHGRSLWIFADFGDDGGWTAGRSQVWSDFIAQAAARPFVRLVIAGIATARKADIVSLVPGGSVYEEEIQPLSIEVLREFFEREVAGSLEDPAGVGEEILAEWARTLDEAPRAERSRLSARLALECKDQVVVSEAEESAGHV